MQVCYKYSDLNIIKIVTGDICENCYCLYFDNRKDCILIDPGNDIEKILDVIQGFKLKSILLTHGHFDHIGVVDKLLDIHSANVFIHELDKELLKDSCKNASSYFGVPFCINSKVYTFKNGDNLDFNIRVLHTPGHTKGSSCFLLDYKNNYIIFTGDTVFNGGYGRTDFYGGDFSELKESLKLIYNLDHEYIAFPGHGEKTIVGKGLL